MSTTPMNNNPMILGLVLIVGAMMYSRRASAAPVRITGNGSLPGSAGTGANQIVGGLVGSLLNLFKTPTTGTWTSYDPTKPSEGVSYDPANPGAYVPLQDLVNGTIDDIANRDNSSYIPASTNDIFNSVLDQTYGGNLSGQSVVMNGGYW